MIGKITGLFKVPLAKEQAMTELEETERMLLKHKTQALYHQKMAEYCTESSVMLSQYNQACSPQ